MHPSAERLVRQEVSKARSQAQLLDDKLKLVPAWSLDDGAARTLVDDAAKIIATFTNVIACLSSPPVSVSCPAALDLDSINSSHDQSREAAVAASTSDTSRSDEDRAPAKKRKINHQQQQQQHSTDQETVPDDGYTWRKYGQKDILGSRHPKSYYRCTHKRESGCPAIKYVQRSDSNPSSFRITYRGEHTCSFSGHGALPRKSPGLSSSPSSSPAPPIINLNSVCLRINSDGGLQLGASGPTVIPTAPMQHQQQQQTLQAPISVPEDLPAAPPPPGSSSGDLEAEDGERQDHRDQLIHEIDVAIAAAGDVSGGVSLESFFLEFGSSLMDGFEQNCPLFDRSSSEWSDCIAY